MHQVATAMQGKQAVETELNRQMDALQQNMPRIVNTLNSHMSNIMTSVSSFMKSAVNKISQIQGMWIIWQTIIQNAIIQFWL